MLVAILLLLLVSYTLRETVSYSFPSHFFHLDGRYCFELTADKPQGQRCNYFVDLRTKYPFIIASFNLGEDNKGYEDSVHVVKPTFWPEINLQQPEDVSIEFTIENVFHQSQLNLSSPFKRIYNCSNFNPFVLRSNGILRLSIPCPVQSQAAHFDLRRNETHSLNNIIRNHLCNINNILPGSWKIDVNFSNRDEDKWSACPNNHKNRYHLYRCPTPYYAAQYYPHSGCFILPLRLSLHLLYRYLERDIRSSSVPQKKAKFNCPFYTFIGDSLKGQIMEAGNCELENHHESLSMGKQYYHDSHSSNGNDININSLWNQYLRNDYPCQPQCLTNQTFAETDGKISPRSYLPPPCKGCSNRVQMTGKIHDHPEAFDYLRKIPQETWFSEYFLVQNGTIVLRETLEALLPQLAKLQRERDYKLDLYFLTLPGVDPATAKKASFGWDEYEKKNRIISDVFSERSMVKYNITVTLIHNDQFFSDRKKKVDGYMISTPDRLHYCVPGTFSPPSFLFEVILHFHARNRLKQEGLID